MPGWPSGLSIRVVLARRRGGFSRDSILSVHPVPEIQQLAPLAAKRSPFGDHDPLPAVDADRLPHSQVPRCRPAAGPPSPDNSSARVPARPVPGLRPAPRDSRPRPETAPASIEGPDAPAASSSGAPGPSQSARSRSNSDQRASVTSRKRAAVSTMNATTGSARLISVSARSEPDWSTAASRSGTASRTSPAGTRRAPIPKPRRLLPQPRGPTSLACASPPAGVRVVGDVAGVFQGSDAQGQRRGFRPFTAAVPRRDRPSAGRNRRFTRDRAGPPPPTERRDGPTPHGRP